jgi:hypothetical protein
MVKLVIVVNIGIDPLQNAHDTINHCPHGAIHCSVFIQKDRTRQSDTQAITTNATALIPEENHWWQKNKLPLA